MGAFPALAQDGCGGAGSIGGIGKWDLVVIGDELVSEDPRFNMAYEVTDSGLVVGQVRRSEGQLAVYRAFFYLDQPLFGFPAGQVRFLPSLGQDGTEQAGVAAIARDVNSDGWIVGDVGELIPNAAPALRRASAWRLNGTGGVESRLVPPPAGNPTATYGWLSSVSDGATPWASFTFEGGTCSMGGPGVSSESVATVRLAGAPDPLVFRGLCAGCAETDVLVPPDTAPSGRTIATGISPDGGRMAGWREDCGFIYLCGFPQNFRARQWFLSSLCSGGSPSACLSCITCITPNPSDTVFDSAARQNAVLDDGVAAGFVADSWPGLSVAGNACGPWAYVWNSINPCSNPPACGGSAEPPLGSALPIPAPMNPNEFDSLVGSEAFDIEHNTSSTRGVCPGRFVVGEVRQKLINKDQPARRGHVWFAPEGPTLNNWVAADINGLVSPIPPIETYSSLVVRSLRGVNRNGDAVGMAEFKRADDPNGTPIPRAVLLRAVPQRLVGDIDRDGTVGAADLAVLLNAWCPSGGMQRCSALADLNCDGWVGAPDLSALLNNWSNTGLRAASTQDELSVPEAVAAESKEEVEFSIQFVGLGDIAGYKAWAATAPEPIRELVEEVVWDITKGGLQ